MIAAGFEFVLFRGEVLSVFDPGMGASTYSAQHPVFPESERSGPRAVGGIADLFHPVAYGPLAAAEQRGRSVRGAGVGGALGRPADDADLRSRAGGGAQEGGGVPTRYCGMIRNEWVTGWIRSRPNDSGGRRQGVSPRPVVQSRQRSRLSVLPPRVVAERRFHRTSRDTGSTP